MVTDEERREIARKLREIDTSDDPLSNIDMDVQIEEVIGVREVADPWPTYEWCLAHNQKYLNRLADLIEPEPERTCHVVVKERKISRTQTLVTKSCSQCGYAFGDEERRPMLPGLDDEIVINRVRIPNYCHNCGAKVVVE